VLADMTLLIRKVMSVFGFVSMMTDNGWGMGQTVTCHVCREDNSCQQKNELKKS